MNHPIAWISRVMFRAVTTLIGGVAICCFVMSFHNAAAAEWCITALPIATGMFFLTPDI